MSIAESEPLLISHLFALAVLPSITSFSLTSLSILLIKNYI